MKHLKHPKHLKHLKHLMWLFGLLFCKHFKELGGKIKDGVHKRQDQKRMLLFPGWIDAIDPIVLNRFYRLDEGFGGGGNALRQHLVVAENAVVVAIADKLRPCCKVNVSWSPS